MPSRRSVLARAFASMGGLAFALVTSVLACQAFEGDGDVGLVSSSDGGGPTGDGEATEDEDAGEVVVATLDFETSGCARVTARTTSVQPSSPGADGSRVACELCYRGTGAVAFADVRVGAVEPGVYRLHLRAAARNDGGAEARATAELDFDAEDGGSIKDSVNVFAAWSFLTTRPFRFPRSASDARITFQVRPNECYAVDSLRLTRTPL